MARGDGTATALAASAASKAALWRGAWEPCTTDNYHPALLCSRRIPADFTTKRCSIFNIKQPQGGEKRAGERGGEGKKRLLNS